METPVRVLERHKVSQLYGGEPTFFLCVCVSVQGYPQRPEEGTRVFETGDTRDYEPQNTGAGYQAEAFWKNSVFYLPFSHLSEPISMKFYLVFWGNLIPQDCKSVTPKPSPVPSVNWDLSELLGAALWCKTLVISKASNGGCGGCSWSSTELHLELPKCLGMPVGDFFS